LESKCITSACDGHDKCLCGEIRLVQVEVNGLYVNHARCFLAEQEAEREAGVYKTMLFDHRKEISVFMTGHSS
jgi:hypothetical protein